MKELDKIKPSDDGIIDDLPARPIIGGAENEPKAKSTHTLWGLAAIAAVLLLAVLMIVL